MALVACPKCYGRGVVKESRPVSFADYDSETVTEYCDYCNRSGKVTPTKKKAYDKPFAPAKHLVIR